MSAAESYLKPDVIRQVSRLDLRARFIVEGFFSGLHSSPFQGFSTEFSEHLRYSQGDDPRNIDWQAYAKTDRYYVKKYQAETNLTGYLLMDLSSSMAYTHRQQLTKFEYSVSLAAALAYLMIHQQDPVGLVAFDEKIRFCLPARSKRSHLGQILSLLTQAEATGTTQIATSLRQFAPMIRQKGLIMIFSDLLNEPDHVIQAIRMLRFQGHDVIVFHVLDEAEVHFPFQGAYELHDPESGQRLTVDSTAIRKQYLEAVHDLRTRYREACQPIGVDFVELDTSMRFDHALMEYLSQRRRRF